MRLLAGSQSVQFMPSPPSPPPQSSTVHTKDVPSRVQCKHAEGRPSCGPKLGVWVGSCLIPWEHTQNGKMVILGIGTVSGDALGLSGRSH